MSQGSFSSSLSEFPLCFICQQAAVGEGPFLHHYLCQRHLAIDIADVEKLNHNVKELLRPHSHDCIALGFEKERLVLEQKLQEMEHKFNELHRQLDEFQTRVLKHFKSRIESVEKNIDECSDINNYEKEVQEARGCGNLSLVRDLAVGMQAHVGEIEAAFSRAASLRDESREIEVDVELRLEKVRRMLSKEPGGSGSAEIGVSARPETRDAGVNTGPASGTIALSHELELDHWVTHVTVCNETSEFRSDSLGRVIPANLADADSASLPQPCLVAKVDGKDHLSILSINGSVRLRTHCEDINWNNICNLHGDCQLLFVLQESELTAVDLSGRTIYRILPHAVGFDRFYGICGNAATVFVCMNNKIAAFNKTTGHFKTLITLRSIPDACFLGIAIHENFVLVADIKHNQVIRVCIDTQQVVVHYPNQRTGISRFEGPRGVTVDSRGRVFVCEFDSQSVRAVASDDGSLLWTLGVPGNRGRDGGRLNRPCDLAVVTGGPCEQLVVADCLNKRLLVLNLH